MLYQPAAFKEERPEILHALIRQARLAVLVSNGAGGVPDVTHLPLLLDTAHGEHGTLYGHVARANPHWQKLREAGRATAIFQGADAYVSPNNYPSKAEHHRVVPAGSGIVTRRSSDIIAADNVHVAKACMHIMTHLDSPSLSVKSVAAHAGISGRGLLKAFVKHAGRTPQEEIALLRDDRVCELLRTTQLNTKQIATATGFSSGNYLARAFRHRHGMSPGQYRRKNTHSHPAAASEGRSGPPDPA